ncbi:MAG: hypothetical protein KAT34_05375 [Candidatus Aminicenantes bacterium]|nr:hypothetical protein [Candidatus Aminicenantes bacterium]
MAATGLPDEEKRDKSIRLVGYFLLIGFFFPIWVQGFGTSKPVFINITGLGKGNILDTIGLLFPLIAGLVILYVGRNVETVVRPVVILSAGLLPVLMSFANTNDLMRASLSRYNSNSSFMLLIMLALIGVYVGSRLVSTTDHIAGRMLGGISGILFLMLVLLPIGKGSKPLFFALFDMFKAGKIAASLVLLGLSMVVIFLAYMYASLIAALNLGDRPNAAQTAENAHKLVFYASVALPVSLLIVLILSGAGFMILVTLLIKLILLFGGIIGAITIGLWDLMGQLLPKTLKGSDLLEKPKPADAPPPNIWNG